MDLTLDQALQKGIEAHKAGKVQEADKYYTAILKAQPDHPDANHNIGVLAVGVGKVEQALPFFKKALDTNPKIEQFWLSYIDALIKLSRLDDAKAILKKAHESGANGEAFKKLESKLNDMPTTEGPQPNDPPQDQLQPLINLYNQGQLQPAVDQALKLLNQFPNSTILHNICGAANAGLKKYDEAVNAYKKAISINPNYPDAYNNMGIALKDQGKLEEAIDAYTKAIELRHDYAEAYNNMGNALQKHGKLEEAIVAFNKAISVKFDYAEAYSNMGNTLKEQGKLEEAIKVYSKALSINPDYAEACSNIGNVRQEQGKLEEAMEAYKKAISINPHYADAYNNLGIVLRKRGRTDEAIIAYRKAIEINQDYPDAHNNLGVSLKDHGKLDEAIEAYKKAIEIKKDYRKAYFNMGFAFSELGRLDEAIEAYKKAIELKPDYGNAWDNIAFCLQALKAKTFSHDHLLSYYPQNTNSELGTVYKDLLNYRLNHGTSRSNKILKEAIKKIRMYSNASIKNPTLDIPPKSTSDCVDNIIALVHFGRSGTGLLHSLIDNHPEVTTLPSIYFSEYFNHSTWEKITQSGWDQMSDNFMRIYDVLFDAGSAVPVETKGKQYIDNVGKIEGLSSVGENADEVLHLDRNIFQSELKRLMNDCSSLNALSFFKLIQKAYDRTINDLDKKKLNFYHIHNPSLFTQLNFINLVPEAQWILMVREPVQSCESWIRDLYGDNDYGGIVIRLRTMLFEIDNIIYNEQNSIGLRLEDLKERPRKTIPALCKWMGIKETDSLYEMTAQGKKWWGDPSSPDYKIDGMDPFGKTSIKRKVGSIFTERDQFILRTLFYPFSVRFGYIPKNDNKFKTDLETIRPYLDELFDFEKKIIKKQELDPKTFTKSGSYLYLRTSLIERWNTLSELNTYPNMIKPLTIKD